MLLAVPHFVCRELFSDFFQSLFGYPLPQLLADSPTPASAQLLYNQMMRDILGGGGHSDALAQVRTQQGWQQRGGWGWAWGCVQG